MEFNGRRFGMCKITDLKLEKREKLTMEGKGSPIVPHQTMTVTS